MARPFLSFAGLRTAFFALFLIGGLGCAGVGALGAVRNVEARRRWTPVAATILESGLSRETTDDMRAMPVVRYGYEVGGTRYESRRISPAGNPVSHETPFLTLASLWIERHPAGMATTALVDPTNPRSAALETGLNYTNSALLFVPLPFVLVGLGGLVGKRRFPWATFLVAWGLLALALHLAAGPVSLFAWGLLALDLFVVVRIVWGAVSSRRS